MSGQQQFRGFSALGRLTVTVQGPHVDSEAAPDHREPLLAQLRSLPRDAPILTIQDDPPSDTEWALLSDHFTGVRDLEIDTGFNEDLNDRKMPLHWPLDRLMISGVCGEVTKSPHILQGLVKHLILYLTSEMRFEGPRSDELTHAYQKAIDRGEAKSEYIPGSKINLINITKLGREWMARKYGDSSAEAELEPENRPVEGQESRLRTLEIIGNDALDAFLRMCAAIPHVVENISTLNLRSTSARPDFLWTEERSFAEILPQLTDLQTLKLSVGEVFHEEATLPALYTSLPPNLTTLHFRGPISLCRSERWEEWVTAFSSDTFLPKLQRLAFVLDMHYEQGKYGKEDSDAPEEDLLQARAACERLYEGARRRGITIEPLQDEWAGKHVCLRPVDRRWPSPRPYPSPFFGP